MHLRARLMAIQEGSESSDHGAVTPVLTGLAFADSCLKSDPNGVCSFGIDAQWGGPCELRQQCKRAGRLSRW
jgi:hypothetical protein